MHELYEICQKMQQGALDNFNFEPLYNERAPHKDA